MRKTQCRSCQKKFDEDMYNGICPKCGVYNRKQSAGEVHDLLHTEYDSGYKHVEQEAATIIHNTLEEDMFVKSKKRNFAIILLVIAILVIAILVIASFIYAQINRIKLNSLYKKTPFFEAEYEKGEVITMKGAYAVVLGAKEITPKAEETIPKGKKLVGIKVQFEIEQYEVKIEPPLLGEEYEIYLKNLDYWEIQEELIGNSTETNLGDKYNYEPMSRGIVSGYYYYLVDKDATEFLVLLQEIDELKDKEYVRSNHQIKITLEEED